MELCPCCGEVAYLEVTDVSLETRELSLDACCEWNLSGWIDSIQNFNRRERARWMLEATGLVVHDILAGADTLRWTLHYGLELRDIKFTAAEEFIQEHHRDCDPPTGWKYGKALFNGGELIGVVTVGRPGSRHLDAQGYRVRRIYQAAKDAAGKSNPDKKGVAYRAVEQITETSPRNTAHEHLMSLRTPTHEVVESRGITYLYARRCGATYPSREDFLVALPAFVATKARYGLEWFEEKWEASQGCLFPLEEAA